MFRNRCPAPFHRALVVGCLTTIMLIRFSSAACPPGTRDEGICKTCPLGKFNYEVGKTSCQPYPECPIFKGIIGDHRIDYFNLTVMQVATLTPGPGYVPAAAPSMLWCFPGGVWKGIVVHGQRSISVDPSSHTYLSEVRVVFGKVFFVTITETTNTVHSFHFAHDYRGA